MVKDKKTNPKERGKGLKPAKNLDSKNASDSDYLWSMSMAPKIDESTHWFQILPAAFFTAIVIIITRMYVYTRPMEQFFWSANENNLTDFFSFYKMVAICICASLALVMLLYRIFCQGLCIKKSFAYIPILIYSVFVLLSYAFSDYKDWAWLGWNDRFEGTVTLIAYMVLLFYIINSINTEKNVKWIIYPVVGSSVLLGLLGLSQALDKDFLRTAIGQKMLISKSSMDASGNLIWDLVDQAAAKGDQWLKFTFQAREIYQTVYNINYVSFYLTLLIPIFGMLFIHSFMKGKEEAIWKKIFWAALFTLTVFNIIGSVSSGGYLGLITIFILGVIVLNKRILKWWKPLVILIVCFGLMVFPNAEQMQKEISAAKGFLGKNTEVVSRSGTGNKDVTPPKEVAHIDYIDTTGDQIKISVNGSYMAITTDFENPGSVIVKDSKEKNVPLTLVSAEDGYLHKFDDKRFSMMKLRPATDENKDSYFLIYIDESEWIFKLTEDGVININQLGKPVDLNIVPHIGFENNPTFGSGRGYIWNTSLPMVKDTLFIGHGADTYCLYFPQNDYVGKYNAGGQGYMNLIFDKPHMMYLGMAINTGLISLLAMCTLWGIYIIQSIILYFRRDFETDFNTYVGLGIFLGVCGFLAAGIVNDSSVSVMPMFYGLLGTGIAINMILKRQVKKA